ncbi:GMC oxidoreductase [Antrihabitans cavernicola]|uniref:Cholesterol oxidase n=1 Tax=Antrihabitans cavernicola TaxID=2495913 RepID=A0A5A7SH71_9NOCA|nr:GMC oxidoreductase [Spelaeibacter cavernicola]KAA0024492.1 twin-arginine translocation signal domain-containing protein [Spelaeibacter cavernicola]
MDRRNFIKAAGVATASLGIGIGGALTAPAVARADGPWASLFRGWVPEIFAPLPDPPEHTTAIVIGSGFGGAISALRLAEAGVATTVLERGSRWPNDPWREIFTGDDLPDGRGFWHRTSFTGVNKVPMHFEDFGGVLDCTEYPGIDVWRAAAVGGGSVVFTGAMVEPQKRHFDDLFRGTVDYDELHNTYYPRVRQMLRLSPVPADIYGSESFTHSRAWDEQVRKAGYQPQAVDSIFNWDVVRAEIDGRSRPSATAARSNLGNSNGAKFDLNQNYLKYAEGTGKARVYPGQRVESIAQDGSGKFTVDVSKISPTGEVLSRRTLTADQLYLGAGSIGTSELLVAARATGRLGNLNEHIGQGWGTNGDVGLARGASVVSGTAQAAPCASRIFDDTGLPVTLENWFIPGVPLDLGALSSLGIVIDPTRGQFGYDAASGRVGLNWPANGNDQALAAARAVDHKIAQLGGSMFEYGALGYDAQAGFTAHPLGGAVLGLATDGNGRVHGHRGLYVVDGAAMPGSAGAANPSLTISALAERNIEAIIRSGG